MLPPGPSSTPDLAEIPRKNRPMGCPEGKLEAILEALLIALLVAVLMVEELDDRDDGGLFARREEDPGVNVDVEVENSKEESVVKDRILDMRTEDEVKGPDEVLDSDKLEVRTMVDVEMLSTPDLELNSESSVLLVILGESEFDKTGAAEIDVKWLIVLEGGRVKLVIVFKSELGSVEITNADEDNGTLARLESGEGPRAAVKVDTPVNVSVEDCC